MQNPSARPKMTQEQARKTLLAWFRSLIIVLLLFFPARMFLQAGRQIDLNKNLFAAIRRNDANRVAFLLKAGADANAREPLHDDRPMLKQIFDRMRGIHGPPGPSPLLIHISMVPNGEEAQSSWRPENIEIAQALLDHHADPNVRGDNEDTPLMMAVWQQKIRTVQLLLKHGARVDLKNAAEQDALRKAIFVGSTEGARLLLDAGADVNSYDGMHTTALIEAIAQQNIEMVKLLIARGADVNVKDIAGVSALRYTQGSVENFPKSRSIHALLKAAGAK